MRRYGSDATVLIANLIEALIASGGWDDADRISAAAFRSITANYPYMVLMIRAELELGRGDFSSAKAHLDAALPSLREDRGLGMYDVYLAELALWERRWVDADAHVEAALTRASSPHTDQLRVWFSAKGLRAVAELAALARARRDADGRGRLARQSGSARHDRPQRRGHGVIDHTQRRRLAGPRRSRERPRPRPWRAGHVVRRGQHLGTPRTPGGGGLLPLARDRGARRRGRTPHGRRHPAAVRTHRCYPDRRRTTEARARAARPTSTARSRRPEPTPPDETSHWADALGLTPREVDVLDLVARGYTNPDIAKALFISVKTASVHVSNILRKLDVPNRREAAAVAHRLTTS